MDNLPQGWVECELKDLLDLQNGYAFSSKDYVKFSNTLNIRMSNIRPNGIFDEDHNIKYLPDEYVEKYKDYLLKDGDLIIAMTDMADNSKILGMPTVVKHSDNKNFLMNQRVGKLIQTSDQGYIPFIKYLLISPKVRDVYKRKGKGGLQLNLSKNDILNIKIAIPTLDVQKQIVEKIEEEFGKIDEGIEKLKLAQEQIKQYKQSVLRSAFEGKLYKTAEWKEKTLEEITCKITDGSHFSPKTVERSKYPYVTVKDINNDAIDFENCKYISEDDYKELLKNGCQPELNDILFSKDGTVGKVTIINYVKKFVILSSLAIIRPNIDIIEPNYLKWALKNPEFLQEAINKKTGVAIRRIILRTLKTLKIKYPKNIEEQKQIVKEIEKRFEVADKAEKVIAENLDKAEQLKQSILKKAFDGRLVPQDPNDEPASILLEKTKAERGKNV